MAFAVARRQALLDEILDARRSILGADHDAYRNHAYRVFNLCRYMAGVAATRDDKIAIAAAFHDLGLFPDGRLDYLEPSIASMRDWTEATGHASWVAELALMIDMHHRVRTYEGAFAALVEPFRKADWIEVSVGVLRFGVPRQLLHELRHAFPLAGFYGTVSKAIGRWAITHPHRPLPMMRW
jgi:hypothetical protein